MVMFFMLIFIVLLILLAIASILFIIGSILLIRYFIKRCKSVGDKARITTPIVIITISIIIAILPLGYIVTQRISNANTFNGYVNTGVYAVYNSKQHTGGDYKLNGVDYDNLQINSNRFMFSDEFKKIKPVANIKKNQNGTDSFISSFFSSLLNTNEIVTLYSIKNNSGYEINYDGEIFSCKKSQLSKVVAFYSNLENYDFYIKLMKYQSLDAQIKTKDMIKIDFNSKNWTKIYSIKKTASYKKFKGEYDCVILRAISPDNLYYDDIYLLLINNKLMFTKSGFIDENSNKCGVLPYDMNKFLLNSIRSNE